MIFQCGDVRCTPGIARMIRDDPIMNDRIAECFDRHINGDWGDLTDEDREMNDESLRYEAEGKMGWRLMSSYSFDHKEGDSAQCVRRRLLFMRFISPSSSNRRKRGRPSRSGCRARAQSPLL